MNRIKIKISKLEAVCRQVETAIRIYFGSGDPVSIHTLAAASFRILVDLDKTGPQTGTFLDFMETQVKPEYIDEVKKLFKEAENFFKHADRDPDKILEFPLAEPELFLWEAFRPGQPIQSRTQSRVQHLLNEWRISARQLMGQTGRQLKYLATHGRSNTAHNRLALANRHCALAQPFKLRPVHFVRQP